LRGSVAAGAFVYDGRSLLLNALLIESRHALIFKRRQTQHKPSAELGAQFAPQTEHFSTRFVRSDITNASPDREASDRLLDRR